MPAAPALEKMPVTKLFQMIWANLAAGLVDCGDAFIAMPR
jgi:hypothetical protein